MSRPSEQPAKALVEEEGSNSLALVAGDFDAARSADATAELRSRIAAWADVVVSRLATVGVVVAASSPAPEPGRELRVDFVARGGSDPRVPPDAAAHADATRLVFGIDGACVRAGLELPAVCARPARVGLSEPARALELSSALAYLPEQFVMGAPGGSSDGATVAPTIAAQAATAADVRELLDRVERGALAGAPANARTSAPARLWLGWQVPRDVAIEHAALLDEQLQDALVALAQIFALLGGVASAVAPARPPNRAGDKQARADRGADDERDREVASRRGRGGAARNRPFPHDRERPPAAAAAHGDGARNRRRDREPAPAIGRAAERTNELAPPDVAAPRRRGLADLKTPPRPGLRPRSPVDSSTAVERGARVEVLKGPFAGKVGIVQDLDGKGGARVMLGLLAVRVDVAHLVPSPAGRTRPVLSSSHRKPLSVRS